MSLAPWMILQYAAHTLSLLDRRKRRHNIPLALGNANFIPPPFFLPSLLFCDIYLAGQKDTYSLPPGTSNHTPLPQSISVAPRWLLRAEASSPCWSLTTHVTILPRFHGLISRVQNLCLQIPVLRASRFWVRICLGCLLKAELEKEDLVRLYDCLNKNGS